MAGPRSLDVDHPLAIPPPRLPANRPATAAARTTGDAGARRCPADANAANAKTSADPATSPAAATAAAPDTEATCRRHTASADNESVVAASDRTDDCAEVGARVQPVDSTFDASVHLADDSADALTAGQRPCAQDARSS